MTLYRDKKSGDLVTIYRESPRMYTGSWYNAYLFSTCRLHSKHVNIEDFDVVATYNRVPG